MNFVMLILTTCRLLDVDHDPNDGAAADDQLVCREFCSKRACFQSGREGNLQ